MREYSDYVEATREYLKRYHDFKATAENLREEIRTQEEALSILPAAPITKYGDDPAGGKSELTTVERESARRQDLMDKIAQKRLEASKIDSVIKRVDRALNALSDGDRALIKGYFFERRSWKELSIRHYMTEKWVRITTNKAIKRMTGIIFGFIPEQQSLFVFYE